MVIFGRNVNKTNNHFLLFIKENQYLVKSSSTQKHFGMVLDTKLDFNFHFKKLQSAVNKTIGLLHNSQNILARESLDTIYKSFKRSHLDYGENL